MPLYHVVAESLGETIDPDMEPQDPFGVFEVAVTDDRLRARFGVFADTANTAAEMVLNTWPQVTVTHASEMPPEFQIT